MATLLLRANGNGSETKLSHHWLLCERARQTEQVGKKVEQQLDACLIQLEQFGHCATFQFGVVAGRPATASVSQVAPSNYTCRSRLHLSV